MRKLLLLVNPMLLQRAHRSRQFADIRALLHASHCHVQVVETTPIGAGPSLTAATLSSVRPDAVFVCGGDGTLLDALQTMADTGIPLGVVPMGTGNVVAQNLRLPRNPAQAAAALLRSTPLRIPLGRVSVASAIAGARSWLFMFAAGAGTHAVLMRAASAAGKYTMGRSAYWAAGMRLLMNHSIVPFEMEYTAAEGRTSTMRVCEALAVRVGSLNVWRPGGGLDRASLRLAFIPETTRLRLAGAITRALWLRSYPLVPDEAAALSSGKPLPISVQYRDVLKVVCRPAAGSVAGETLPVQADGEILGSTPATIEVSDRSVHLLGAEAVTQQTVGGHPSSGPGDVSE